MNLIKSFLKWVLKATLKNRSIKFKKNKVKKVLVYGYTGLGNFVMYIPALRAMKDYIPNAQFTLLHGNDTGCHEIVSENDLFDDYVVIKRDTDWATRLKWIWKIRRKRFDLIISDFHGNCKFLVLATTFSGAKYRVGHVSSPGWNNEWDKIYNLPVKMQKDQHEIDRYLELAYALGIPEQRVDKKPFIHLNSKHRNFAERFFAFHGIKSKDKIISMQFGTSPTMQWKQWDLDRYRKLCNKILDLPNTKVILHGSSAEMDMIESVASKIISEPIIAVGRTTIKQAAALLEKSDILICNDSGLMHLAVAVNTPVIAIYGPTDYTRTAPIGEQHTIIRKNLKCSPCFKMEGTEKVENCPYNYRCLNSVSVDEVFRITKEKLKVKKD